MSPRDLSVSTILRRLTLMRELLEDLEVLGEPSVASLGRERVKRRALERILSQLVDLACNINQHVASSKLSLPPGDYQASFDAAVQVGMISPELAASLKPSVGMRNVLIHEYAEINLKLVAAAVPMAKQQFGEYVRQVASWLKDQV